MSTVFDEIREARDCGVVRCGAAPAGSPEEAAAAFGLAVAGAVHREIEREAARTIVVGLLHRDMAYDGEVMPLARAVALADRFLAEVAPGTCRCFTNLEPGAAVHALGAPTLRRFHGWRPATEATFDAGVLVVGRERAACFWVEDED